MKVSRYRIVSNYWKNLTNDCCVFEGKVTSMEFRLTSEQYGRVVNSSSLLFIVVRRIFFIGRSTTRAIVHSVFPSVKISMSLEASPL